MLQLYHTAYAVPDLDRALAEFESVLGGRATEPVSFEMLVHMPFDGPKPRRVRGRSAWIIGEPVPVELWEGGPGMPWALANGYLGPHLHHSCYWADDLDTVAVGCREPIERKAAGISNRRSRSRRRLRHEGAARSTCLAAGRRRASKSRSARTTKSRSPAR